VVHRAGCAARGKIALLFSCLATCIRTFKLVGLYVCYTSGALGVLIYDSTFCCIHAIASPYTSLHGETVATGVFSQQQLLTTPRTSVSRFQHPLHLISLSTLLDANGSPAKLLPVIFFTVNIGLPGASATDAQLYRTRFAWRYPDWRWDILHVIYICTPLCVRLLC